MQYFTRTIDDAQLTGYIPSNSPEIDMTRIRPTVLILPGGGYEMTSDREAEPVALNFLAADYNVFILRYSCKPATYPTQVLQVAAAVREIHEHAAEWNVDPAHMVVLGFSAGGHLAAHFATSASDAVLREHGYDPQALRPAGLMLAYPVITAGEQRHDGSFRALLGDHYGEPAAMEAVSIEHHIDAATPPTFIWHTMTDDTVPVENTLMFVQGCLRANVPVEAHLFPHGGHGLALSTPQTAWGGVNGIEPGVEQWFNLSLNWMQRLFIQ